MNSLRKEPPILWTVDCDVSLSYFIPSALYRSAFQAWPTITGAGITATSSLICSRVYNNALPSSSNAPKTSPTKSANNSHNCPQNGSQSPHIRSQPQQVAHLHDVHPHVEPQQ